MGGKQNKGKGIQCRECESFEHIHVELTKFLRNQKNGQNTTFFYDELDVESEYEKATNVVEFTTHIWSGSDIHNNRDTSVDNLSSNVLVEAYKILYLKWNDEWKASEKKKDKIGFLLQDKARLMATISELKK